MFLFSLDFIFVKACCMALALGRFRLQYILMLLLFMLSSSSLLGVFAALPSLSSSEFFRYEFIVDEDGFTLVKIRYTSSGSGVGSSWVFVPRFSPWINRTVHGRIYSWSIGEPEEYTGSPYYFYKVFNFSFMHDSGFFELLIEYNFSTAAMIIEPNGMFYSPQIGFESGCGFEAAVIFPSSFRVNLGEALAIGRASYGYDRSLSNSSFIVFRNLPQSENLLRIQVGFRVNREPDLVVLDSSVFKFSTVRRYESYARKILELYNETYNLFVDLFNVTLGQIDSINVRFFIPDFYSLMSVGGYVPFSGGSMGDIYVNFVFTRYVEGYLEVIALHELVHHFMWRAGLSPNNLLWFHEGLAQYVSIEFAERLGFEGARMIRSDIEASVQRVRALVSDNFGFLASWTPKYAPRDMSTLYAAAYYVVSELANEYGGLNFYARFFRVLGGGSIEDNAALCYYLSLAAGESIVERFNSWGFNIPDLYTYTPLIREVELAIEGMDGRNILLQPFRHLANLIYRGVISGWMPAEAAPSLLLTALLIARLAPLLALITYSGIIFVALILALKVKGVL